MQIDRRDSEPGPVNLWGLVRDAIQSNAMTARLAVLLVLVLAVLGTLAYLGVHVSL